MSREFLVKRTFGSVVITAATNVALAGLGACTGVIAARLLGAEGRGQLAAIQLWPGVFALLAMMGLPEAIVFFVAREPARAARYIATATAMALLASIIVGGVAWVLLPGLLSSQPASVVAAARVYLLTLPAFAISGVAFHALRGVGQFGWWNVCRASSPIAWLTVLLVGWMLRVKDPSLYAYAFLAWLMVQALPVAMLILRKRPPPRVPDVGLVGPLLSYGVPAAIAVVPQSLNLRMDQMLMGALFPSERLGIYVAAVAWASVIMPLSTALGSALFPRVAGEKSSACDRITRYSRSAVLVGTLAAMSMAPITPIGVARLFGPEFADAAGPARLLLLASVLLGLNFVLAEALRGLGKPTGPLVGELWGAAVTAAVLIVLLDRLGVMGAAISSVAGYSATSVVLSRQVQVVSGASYRDLLLPRRADVRFLVSALRSSIGVSAR